MGKQPESRVSTSIMKEWKRRGAWCMKVHGGPMQLTGVPDIAGVVEGQAIYCETKMPGNKPTLVQWKRIRDLRRAGALVCVAYSVSDAVQMIEHALSGDHTFAECDCLYSEIIDLQEIVEQGKNNG